MLSHTVQGTSKSSGATRDTQDPRFRFDAWLTEGAHSSYMQPKLAMIGSTSIASGWSRRLASNICRAARARFALSNSEKSRAAYTLSLIFRIALSIFGESRVAWPSRVLARASISTQPGVRAQALSSCRTKLACRAGAMLPAYIWAIARLFAARGSWGDEVATASNSAAAPTAYLLEHCF